MWNDKHKSLLKRQREATDEERSRILKTELGKNTFNENKTKQNINSTPTPALTDKNEWNLIVFKIIFFLVLLGATT